MTQRDVRATGTPVASEIHYRPQTNTAELGYFMNACCGEWLGVPATGFIGSSGGQDKGPITDECLQPVTCFMQILAMEGVQSCPSHIG